MNTNGKPLTPLATPSDSIVVYHIIIIIIIIFISQAKGRTDTICAAARGNAWPLYLAM
jgi:hypothetical protein